MNTDLSEKHEKFLHSYLQLIQADLFKKDGIVNIIFPSSVRKKFGKSHVKICFDKIISEKNNCELLQPGTKTLEMIYEDCLSHGFVSSYRLKEEEILPNHDIKNLLEFKNCIVESQGSFSYMKYAYLFLFKISYDLLDPTPRLMTISVDIKTLEHLEWLTLSLPLYEKLMIENLPKGVTKNKVNQAYQSSLSYLKKNLEKEFQQIEFESKKRLAKELERISRYYANLKKEEQDRIKEFRKQLKIVENKLKHHKTLNSFKRYHDAKNKLMRKIEEETKKLYTYFKKIDEFELKEKEKEKRKYEPHCDIHLVSIALIQYFMTRYRFLLLKTDTQKILDLNYVPVASKIILPKCSICKKETTRINLASQSNIICDNCQLHST